MKNEPMNEKISQLFETASKIAALLGPFVIGAAVLWLNANFVSRAEFEKMSERIGKLDTAIILLIEQQKSDDRQDKRIDDHESRLRVLESRIVNR